MADDEESPRGRVASTLDTAAFAVTDSIKMFDTLGLNPASGRKLSDDERAAINQEIGTVFRILEKASLIFVNTRRPEEVRQAAQIRDLVNTYRRELLQLNERGATPERVNELRDKWEKEVRRRSDKIQGLE